jgi:hypothetical protein
MCNNNVNNIDGVFGDADICQHLGNQYNDLYNSVPYNNDGMTAITNQVNELIKEKAENVCVNISINDITTAVSHLICGKRDDEVIVLIMLYMDLKYCTPT